MAIFRVEKSVNYTVMSNYHLRDSALTLKAKGLLSQMLSLPEEWDYTLSGLATINKEGKDAIRSAVQELEQAGYIQRRQTHDENGNFAGNEYIIHEQPVFDEPKYDVTVTGGADADEPLDDQLDLPLLDFPTTENPSTENPSSEKPSPEKPLTENPTEINKDISSKDKKKKKKEKEKREPKSAPDWKPERFAAFWEYYRTHCRGESKQDAIRAWDRLKPDDALIDLMGKALQKQIRSPDWQRGIGIPYASTWLNNFRWEDELNTSGDASRDGAVSVKEGWD